MGKVWRKLKLKAILILNVSDGNGGTSTRNMGKGMLNEISFVEYVFYILAKHWKCPEAFIKVGL